MNDFFNILSIPSGYFRETVPIVTIFILFSVSVYVLLNINAKKLKTKRVTFYEQSSEKNNFRCVFISDLHINCLAPKKEEIIEEIAAENPDFIVFTGDIAHSAKPKYRKEALEFFENIIIACGCPIYITYGNHDETDFFEGSSALRKAFTKDLSDISPRIYVLENDSRVFTKNGRDLVVGGLVNVTENKADIQSVCNYWKKQADESEARLLVISHNPDILLKTGPEAGDVFLSGHTHGGQVLLPFHMEFKLLRPHDKLACKGISYGKHVYNNTPLYITSGLGTSLLPIRFRTNAEVVLVEIGMK